MQLTTIRTDKQGALHLSVKTAEWLMERIQTDTKSGDISRLRQHVATFGHAEGCPVAATMARVLPSAKFVRTEGGSLQAAAFSGVVWLHVGGLLRRDDIEAAKERSKVLPTTLAAFEGADGRSVEILVAVTTKDGASPVTEAQMDRLCRQAYDVAFGIYTSVMPQPVERQAVSIRNGFLMPFDPQPYYNSEATPLTVDDRPVTTGTAMEAATGLSEQREVDMRLYGDYELMYRRAAEEAADDTADIVESQRQEAYVTELARRLCLRGMPAEEAFLHMSNHHRFKATYSEYDYRAIVDAVYAEEQPRRMAEADSVGRDTRRLIDFLNRRYVFRYNTVMGYAEYRPNNTWVQDWQPCDENAVNGMTLQARLADLDVRDKDVRRYVHSNMIRPSDPVDDYLQKAAKAWDGHTDHIAMLARCVPCDLPQWEAWFKKWFVSMVAQWVLPRQDYGNSIVPMLISAQGDGKTSFCRMLLPRELSWGFLENLDVSEKRATLQAMHNFLLINLDEFNQISPRLQEGFLKNVIQLPAVKIKRPYGKHVEEFKRNASFIATTNDQHVLSDPTGSRRFICVQLTAPIRTDYKPDYEGLYGQAYALATDRHARWYFDADEVKAIQEHNRAYQQQPPALQFFYQHFDVVQDDDEGTWLTVAAIYERLRSLVGTGLSVAGVSRFGRVLYGVEGIRRKRTSNGVAYLVREKS